MEFSYWVDRSNASRTFLLVCLIDHLRNSFTQRALKSRTAVSVGDTRPSYGSQNNTVTMVTALVKLTKIS